MINRVELIIHNNSKETIYLGNPMASPWSIQRDEVFTLRTSQDFSIKNKKNQEMEYQSSIINGAEVRIVFGIKKYYLTKLGKLFWELK
jgi:hypothetical protein